MTRTSKTRPGRRSRLPRTLLLVIAMLAIGFSEASGGQAAGRCAFAFVKLPAEPVGASLAGTHLATVGGPASNAWNPAGLAMQRGCSALVSHATWVAETCWEWGALAMELPGGRGALGLSCGMLRSGGLEGYTEDGTSTGDFSPLQVHATVGYGRCVGDCWTMGFLVEAVVDGDGEHQAMTAWAGGGGIQLDLGRVSLGLAALHLAPDQKVGKERFPMPATVSVGASLRLPAGMDLHSTVEMTAAEEPRVALGAQWRPVSGMGLCAGTHWDREEAEEPVGLAVGMTVDISRVQIAYGFQPQQALEASHQISLRLPIFN
ncbi:MAG: hypothetical protein KAY24_05310 [Candidatus Eisenbacteria sp.]|nr:hypothetical protein [Candidatus Eisenbacteria bacterium]